MDEKLSEEKEREMEEERKKWIVAIKKMFERDLERAWDVFNQPTVGKALGMSKEKELYILDLVEEAMTQRSQKHETLLFLKDKDLKDTELVLASFYAGIFTAEFTFFMERLIYLKKHRHALEKEKELLRRLAVERITEELFSLEESDEFIFGS
ncbi:hypothetical protein J7K24_02220 [bacterium]|nr:hypothetical protein [bacterium]